MSRFLTILLALAFATTLAFGQAGTVRINEIMYDDANSGTDLEWVELHNTTASDIDISGWYLSDDDVYPSNGGSGEGEIVIPSGTILPANGYVVISKVALPDLAIEVVGTDVWNQLALGNSGDNLALYNAATGGVLIDGVTNNVVADRYPDLAASNVGYSIEKCDENAAWPGANIAAWKFSTNVFSGTGSYRQCTPGFANSPCADATPPTVVSATAFNATDVDVLFSEPVELVSAETEVNYNVPTIGNPLTAVRDGVNQAKVHLTFNPLANNVYTLNVTDVSDLFNNVGGGSAQFTVNVTVNPGDVVITEIMYDDTASTDAEWVEIHNRTSSPIDISGWALVDDDVYPGNGGEGVIEVPDGYEIPANGFAILCRVDLPGITGEIICTPISGTWTLGNSGDNVALFTASNNGTLVDGSLTEFYPDLAFGNAGNSIEKCDYETTWTNDPAAWTETKVYYGPNQYYRCTPFSQGFCCPDPAAGSVTISTYGPPSWEYTLHHVSGCVEKVLFTNFCVGTTGSTTANGWHVTTDGNDGDTIIFYADQPITSGQVGGFWLNHPWCADFVNWASGGNSGQVEGPLPVELTSFDAVAGDAQVRIVWSTESESELTRFEITRDGATVASIAATNSATGSNYSFTDENLANGRTYEYALYVTDIEGTRRLLDTDAATPSANNAVVTEFALHQNYPNPFNPETSIRFDLAEASDVTLTIFNISGQEVATLVNGNLASGAHTVNFDAANLTSGVYLYRLTAGSFTAQKKMMLLK